jgi:hypothetical protein
MTAAALLVVLGAALIMQATGMSMALGAFLAGVLLAESNYRHELEADIEPFRGLLLALFFMGIGMTIDMNVVQHNAALILGAAVVLTVLKAGIVFLLYQATCAGADALRAGSVLTGAGEFAFVLLPLGASLAIFDAAQVSHHHDAGTAGRRPVGPGFASMVEAQSARARRFQRRARISAGDRLRPLRPDRLAMPLGGGRRCHHHRQGPGHDPGRRSVRLQDLLRRRHAARRAARRRRRASQADRGLHR